MSSFKWVFFSIHPNETQPPACKDKIGMCVSVAPPLSSIPAPIYCANNRTDAPDGCPSPQFATQIFNRRHVHDTPKKIYVSRICNYCRGCCRNMKSWSCMNDILFLGACNFFVRK